MTEEDFAKLELRMEPLTETKQGQIYVLAASANPVQGRPGDVKMAMMPVRLVLVNTETDQEIEAVFVPPDGTEAPDPPSRILRVGPNLKSV